MNLMDLRSWLNHQDQTPAWRATALRLVCNTAYLLELFTGAEPGGEATARCAQLVSTSRDSFDGLLTLARRSAVTMAAEAEVERIDGWSTYFFELADDLRESIQLRLADVGQATDHQDTEEDDERYFHERTALL
jgi:hypothetical protein